MVQPFVELRRASYFGGLGVFLSLTHDIILCMSHFLSASVRSRCLSLFFSNVSRNFRDSGRASTSSQWPSTLDSNSCSAGSPHGDACSNAIHDPDPVHPVAGVANISSGDPSTGMGDAHTMRDVRPHSRTPS